MNQLSEVSETALITLRSRVYESQKQAPLMEDPVGEELLSKLLDTLPEDSRKRILGAKLSPMLARHITLRARKYDQLCKDFLREHPNGLIVSLGCGFDTRFWRLGGTDLKYMELDLPSVIQIKQDLLGDKIKYRLLSESVLEEAWIPEVKKIQSKQVLFIAEGLFMYLPRDQVVQILKLMAESFSKSRLVLEVIDEKYTRGFRKKMVERKMRRGAGTTAGDYYQFGIKKASDLESYHPGFRISGEWSYFEDPDIKPAILKLLRHSRSLSKTQYTVIAEIA